MIATKEEVQEAVNTQLWIRHSFLAAISARIGTEFVESDLDQLAWTDGKSISVNWRYIQESEDWQSLSVANIIFMICHEVGHLLNLTIDRRGSRHHKFWNYATDYSINSDLINNCDGHGKPKPIGEMYYNDKFIKPDNPARPVFAQCGSAVADLLSGTNTLHIASMYKSRCSGL